MWARALRRAPTTGRRGQHLPPSGKDSTKEELLPKLREQIDNMAGTWNREQKDACLAETAASFKGGGSLLRYLREPPQ